MKTYLVTPFILLLSMTCASCQDKSQLQITLAVTDDESVPLEGASVTTHVLDTWKPSSSGGFGQEIYERPVVVTDKEGKAVLKASTSRANLVLTGSKPGYYDGSAGYKSATTLGDRWQPWNPTIPVILKRVRNPISLIAKKVSPDYGQYTPLPADKAAYDLELGDWTVPYGIGRTADLVFEIRGKTDRPGQNYDTTLTLSFSHPQDGLVYVERPKDRGSMMVMPYLAPDNGYQSQKSWRKLRINTEVIKGGYKEGKLLDETKPDEDYFLRLRTKLNEKGEIVSAHYAKVQGSFLWGMEGYIKFQYHFNPTPNDRNLEFDPKRNLLKVEKWQQVTDP
ncbi:MAG: hypothetical protein JNG86_00125 [Verrucomicrobiaceae bacterium]|nr:hypothetical protein [Verrucomicrobiaceae bacterium]